LANNPYPVEARFLLACQTDHPEARNFEHPFPLIDLASMFLAVGITARDQREAFITEVLGDTPDLSHNPRWDAWITALIAFKVMEHADRRHLLL
jgi:hypothetical protein